MGKINKILIAFAFLINISSSCAQRLFFCDSIIHETEDSVFITGNCERYLSLAKFPDEILYDSIITDLINLTAETLEISYIEDKNTSYGIYEVYIFGARLVQSTEMYKRKPWGESTLYENSVINNKKLQIGRKVSFVNGKRDGWYIIYDLYPDSFIVKALYRDGVLIESFE